MKQKFFIEDKTLFFRWGNNPIKIRTFPKFSQAKRAKKTLLQNYPKIKNKKHLDGILDALQAQMDLQFNDGQMGLGLSL